jgi:hypothetical protein
VALLLLALLLTLLLLWQLCRCTAPQLPDLQQLLLPGVMGLTAAEKTQLGK